MEHLRQDEVIGEERLTCHLCVSIDAPMAAANNR